MKSYSLSHLSDPVLTRDLVAADGSYRTSTAVLLAHIAEFDARELYLPAAYPSMHAYCVGELHQDEEVAYKRIRAARVARGFPALFGALADGRLTLTAIILLAPNLTEATAADLITAATHRTAAEVRQMLANRFPQRDVPSRIDAISPTNTAQLDLNPVEARNRQGLPVETERPKLSPLSPQHFSLQATLDQEAHDMLRHLQALLGHAIPSCDLNAALKYAFKVAVARLEQQKFAVSARSKPGRTQGAPKGRYIPADVRRAVLERDGAQCTFTSDRNHRCEATSRLEFDHIESVARGGEATVANLRLRCRAHNQFEAENAFGKNFMQQKRDEARRRTDEARKRRAAEREAAKAKRAAASDPERDVTPWLRQLGFRAHEARRAAALCESMPDASLEQRMRFALSQLAPPSARHGSA